MGKKAKRAALPVNRLPVNRRALSRREREDRFRRRLYIGGGILLALILAVTSAGLIQTLVIAPASPVATVNGVPIRTDSYQRTVQYRRYELRSYLAQLTEQLRQLDPRNEAQAGFRGYLEQQRQSLLGQLGGLPTEVLEDLIEGELIRQEAARRGLTVTDEQVRREIEQQFGYNPEAPAPTPEPTPAPTPTPGGPTPTPPPTPMSEQRFRELYNEYLRALRENTGLGEADLLRMTRDTLLRRELQQAMGAEVPTAAEQVRARHILVEKEEQAQAALERIRQGADFAAIAKEASLDTTSGAEGGDLGWFPRGQMVPEFEQAVFALQPGQVSDLVQTTFGFHIIQVVERDPSRPLDDQQLIMARDGALERWLSEKGQDPQVVQRFWSWDKVPKDRTADWR